MPETENYLGDGVYASFDGYQIWLRTGDGGNQWIALEPAVMQALLYYAHKCMGAQEKQEPSLFIEGYFADRVRAGERPDYSGAQKPLPDPPANVDSAREFYVAPGYGQPRDAPTDRETTVRAQVEEVQREGRRRAAQTFVGDQSREEVMPHVQGLSASGQDTPPASPLHKAGPLLPCPFCGGNAGIVPVDADEDLDVFCEDCDATIESCTDRASAIAAWNRRTPASAPPDGWRVVPIKPTSAMLAATDRETSELKGEGTWRWVARLWAAMLAACPPPPKEDG